MTGSDEKLIITRVNKLYKNKRYLRYKKPELFILASRQIQEEQLRSLNRKDTLKPFKKRKYKTKLQIEKEGLNMLKKSIKRGKK